MSVCHNRRRLSGGTMLLALATASLPTAAWADNECGSAESGQVTCDPGEAEGSGQILYIVDPVENSSLTIDVAEGFSFQGGAPAPAIYAANLNGALTLNAAALDLTTNGVGSSGLMAATNNGDLTINIRDVSTNGAQAAGVIGVAGNGNAVINARNIETQGSDAHGIAADTSNGDATINVAQIHTGGFSSDGINVSSGRNVTINAGTITTAGDWSFGITSVSLGDANIKVDRVETSGFAGVGITADAVGNVDVVVNEVTTSGDGGSGIAVGSLGGAASVNARKIATKGDYADGVVAVTSFEEASVVVGEVTTQGEYSFGVFAGSSYFSGSVAADSVSTKGDFSDGVSVDAGLEATARVKDVSTQGHYAFGVFALGGTTHIQALGAISTKGDESAAVVATSRAGDATINLSGSVTTSGRNAHGLWATSDLGGTAKVRSDGSILTSGSGANAINVDAFIGDADIKVKQAETKGEGAHAIDVETLAEGGIHPTAPRPHGVPADGGFSIMEVVGSPGIDNDGSFDIRIAADSLATSGLGSIGVRAKSVGGADVDVGHVLARQAKAISIEALQAAALKVRGTVKSVNDDGALLSGSNVEATIHSGASLVGGNSGLVIRANGAPPPAENRLAAAAGSAIVTNEGTIAGGTGHAIKVEAGVATIDNRGTILGSLSFAGGDDRFLNKKLHEFGKDSDFGAGSDLYHNQGELRLLRGDRPLEISLSGLELFRNEGLVNLANGVAGDSLSLSGDYLGHGSAALLLEIDPGKAQADRLIVGGKLEGKTKVDFVIAGQGGLIGNNRIVIAQAADASGTDALEVGQSGWGFVGYGITFDAATSEYLLVSAVGEGAHRASSMAAGARHGLSDVADSWSTHAAQQRDGLEPGRGFWAVGSYSGAKGDRSVDSAAARSIIEYEENRQSYLAGVDLLSMGEDGGFTGGLLAGYQHGELDFRNSSENSGIETVIVGAYARYSHGPVFANLFAQYARHWLRYQADDLGIDQRSDGSSWGVRLEGGYRLGSEDWFFEPTVGVAVYRQDLDALEADGQRLHIDPLTYGRLSLGTRSGARLGSVAGLSLRGTASAGFARNFGKEETLRLTTGEQEATSRVAREKSSVWAGFGIDVEGSGPLSGFAQVRVDRADDIRANTIRAGLNLKL